MLEQALAGLKVLDLSQGVAGPYCTKLLAGLGAEVIKVEPPQGGDPTRNEGPFFQDQPGIENSGLFHLLNSGKKSLTLDVTQPSGKRVFRQLAQQVDVVVESFKPGTLDSLGLGYGALSSLSSGLVLTSITPFGQAGPYAGFAATHLTMDAMAGLTYLRGNLDREPVYPGGSVGEYAGGLGGFVGTLIALAERAESGLGQQVDISIMETLLNYNEGFLVYYAWQGMVPNRNFWPANGFGFLPCRDGYALVRPALGRFEDFARFVDKPELWDEKFRTTAGRSKYHAEVNAILTSWLMGHDKKEIFQAGQQQHLPFGYVATAEDLLSDPQNEARAFFVEVEHPAVGKIKYPGAPFHLSETPWMLAGIAPTVGQHTSELLSELLDYEEPDVARLRREGVV